MNRALEWLSQASPDEALIPGTTLAVAGVQRALRQLRQRAQHEGKSGERARRLLAYLEGGNADDAKFEGVSLVKLQSAVQRARSRSRTSVSSPPAEDRNAPGNTLQRIIADVSQGNPSDTWVDGVNITRLEKWFARLQGRAGGAKALNEPPVRKANAAGVRAAPAVHVETATATTPRAAGRQNKADRQSEWIDDFLE